MFNQITLIGRIGQQPQAKSLQSGQTLCSFSLATSRSYQQNNEWKEETQWHNITVWGKAAEKVSKYDKGDQCLVVGELRYRKYTGQDGVERTVAEIVADKVQRVSKPQPKPFEHQPYTPAETFSETAAADNLMGGTDDLPF